MKGLVLALQFLTRLPAPRVHAGEADFAGAIRFFPAAGLVIGALVAGAAWAGARVDPWTGALVALLCWVLLTGALHLDGLADIADAHGAAHKEPERLRAVLADPHVGSFGVVALVMQLLAKLVLLHGLIAAGQLWPLLLVPAAARIGPLLWAHWLPPLHEGLGARFAGVVGRGELLGWLLLPVLGGLVWPAYLVTPLILFGWGWHLRRRLGGISGDGHGAGIEVVESLLLLALLIVQGGAAWPR